MIYYDQKIKTNDFVMTKIAVISPSKFPGTGGDTSNYTGIINELAREGYQVFLICPKNQISKELSPSISTGITIIRIPFLPPRLKEIQDKIKAIDYIRYLIFLVIEFFKVWRVLKREKIKYALVRHDVLTIQLPFLLRLLKLRSIADGELLGEILKNKTKKILFSLVQRYENRAVNNYNLFAVTSEGQSNNLQKIGFPKSKIIINPTGTNLEQIPKFSIDKIPEHTFGYFGVLEEWQGLDILLEGFQILLKKIPKAKLFILGDGTLKPKLKKSVEEYGLSSNVIFDTVSREDLLNNYFKKFRIVVIPRPKLKDGRDQIIPIKLIESIAAAKPTMVFDIPMVSKFPKNSVYIIKSCDSESLAYSMEEFSSNENKMKEFSKNAYSASKNFDIQNVVKKLVNSLIYSAKE